MRQSGPFKCVSLANGHILVKPAWSQYKTVWNVEDGGGPGFMGRMGLASQLETFLNQIYTETQTEAGFERVRQHDINLEKAGG